MLAGHVLTAVIIMAVFLTLAITYIAVQGYRTRRNYDGTKNTKNLVSRILYAADIGGGLVFFLGGGVALLTVALALIPFSPKYWVLTPYEGTIDTLSSQTVIESKDLTPRYVVTLEGIDEQMITTDPRIMLFEEGEQIEFICGWEWVYGGADRLNCNVITN